MKLTTSLGQTTRLAASETARIHFTKAGKMIIMPYPCSIAAIRYPHGLTTYAGDDADFAELALDNRHYLASVIVADVLRAA